MELTKGIGILLTCIAVNAYAMSCPKFCYEHCYRLCPEKCENNCSDARICPWGFKKCESQCLVKECGLENNP